MNYSHLLELLQERALKGKPDQLNFVLSRGEIQGHSYQGVYKKVQEYAQQLVDMGVVAGDRVGIVLPTCVEFFYAFYGAQMAGAIPFAIYPPVRLAKVDEWQAHSETLLKLVQTKAVLTNKQIFDLLVSPTMKADVDLGLHRVEDFGVAFRDDFDRKVHEIAFLQFSSGSTGTPKPVAISHKNALHNALEIWRASHLKSEDVRLVSWLPLYHDMGLIGTCMSSLRADGELYLIRPENFIGSPFLWLQTMSRVKATVTVAPNFSYGLCARRVTEEQLRELDLSHMKMMGCGAEMIHPQTMSEFIKKFQTCGLDAKALRPCYGLAEATLAVTFVDAGQGVTFKNFDRDKILNEQKVEEVDSGEGIAFASVGKPVGDTQLKIMGQEGSPCEEGRVGRLFVQSPSIMHGYFGMEDKTREVIESGWLDTQDRAFLHKGELYIVGREKDTIIIRGSNIDPTLIERSLLDVPELRTGCYAVFSSFQAFSEEAQCEGLIVVCEVSDPRRLDDEARKQLEGQIRKLINKKHNIMAQRVVLLNPGSIPRTSSGKIRRSLAKSMWEAGTLESDQSTGKKTLWKVGSAIVKGKLLNLVGSHAPSKNNKKQAS